MCPREISRMRGSRSAIRLGVKPRATSERMRSWRGGSIARKDAVCDGSGWLDFSSETPFALERCSVSLKPASTSS